MEQGGATARVAPPHHDVMTPDTAALLALTAPPGRPPPGTVAVLAHAAELLAPFLGWAAALAMRGTLPKRDHEILALRAAWNCRSPYEWGEHVEYARAAGIDDADIARIGAGSGGDASGLTAPHEAALVDAADELHRRCALSDATWEALARHYSDAQLVEAVYVVGQYTMLSMVANALCVPVPDGLAPLPDGDAR